MISDAIKKGAQNAPHRALYHALGMTDEEINHLRTNVCESVSAGSMCISGKRSAM